MHKITRKFFTWFCVIAILSNFVYFTSNAKAVPGASAAKTYATSVATGKLMVSDDEGNSWEEASWYETAAFKLKYEFLQEYLLKTLPKAGSIALNSAVRSALNTIAFDTATWLGSGGKGQKPMFITEGWGTYLTNVADNAAGTFIEKFGRTGLKNYNMCDPGGLKAVIGLGLTQYTRPSTPKCTFTQLTQNWEKSLSNSDFLSQFQDMFKPVSNQVGITLSVNIMFAEQINKAIKSWELDRLESGGWLDVRDIISQKRTSSPQRAKREEEAINDLLNLNITKYTGDALSDAASVFLNQLLITLINTLLRNLASGADTYTHSYSGSYYDFQSQGDQVVSGGINGAKERFRKILEPIFNERGSYDILSELSTCTNPDKPGPTDCVINDKFKDAVMNQLTVGRAMKVGEYLNPKGTFGFTSADALEPNYNEAYPYRSMVILRKFRIIPVGWEVAAQYIKKHFNDSDVNKTKSLEDLVNCFDDHDEYVGYHEAWCEGLIDPNWVLKAPYNYCKRDGYGNQIINTVTTGLGDDSSLSVIRKNKYCADEQTCIKEGKGKSCDYYGYCSEERRAWNFNADTCEPIDNTCQSYRSRDGKTASYLDNSLNFGPCSADSVGCKGYCTDYDPSTTDGKWNCTTAYVSSPSNKIFLNKNIETCQESDEGCHEFIRTKTAGANLLSNSSFEDDLNGWTASGPEASVVDTEKYTGNKSLKITNSGPGYVWARKKIGSIMPGDYVSVSYYVKTDLTTKTLNGPWLAVFPLDIGGNPIHSEFLTPADTCDTLNCIEESVVKEEVVGGSEWKLRSFTFIVPSLTSFIQLELRVQDIAGDAYFDAIKIERSAQPTEYSGYRDNGLVYEKLLPSYYDNACYAAPGTDYTLKSGAPDYCSDYIRKCNKEEVDCELYTNVRENFSIPAKVKGDDFCPSECVGYDNYIQRNTVFDSKRAEYFIPKTAKKCSAGAVGCDEFTNLDKTDLQGEQKEYYISLKQCIKPNDPAATCNEFYTWEGSDETGYQLHVFSLDGTASDPFVTEPDGTECNSAIYTLLASDPGYNPDCRQYYSKSGNISYHLYSRTITCEENCHPYRRTEGNTLINLDDCNEECGTSPDCKCGTDCSDGAANNAKSCKLSDYEYIYCKNGGVWRTDHQACVYNAIPNEGEKCSASMAGCREYTGNSGNNMQVVKVFDFEKGDTDYWAGVNGTSVANSNEALIVGGHSLLVSGGTHTASTSLGYSLIKDSSYTLNFLVRGATSLVNLTFYFTDGTNKATFTPESISVGPGEWKFFRVNLETLDHEVSESESLQIEGDGDFYIDSIKLTEIINRYYLIKNSWDTPVSCDNPLSNPTGAGCAYNRCSIGEMLGCDQYRDRNKNDNYLKKFSQLCQESAVGCELMIDTYNSASPFEQTFPNKSGSTVSPKITVPADVEIYAVYDKTKTCNPNDKGCQRVGDPVYRYELETIFKNKFLLNDPDKYNDSLCSQTSDGCEEYVAKDGSLTYFINPYDQVCEYRKSSLNNEEGWWKKKIKRCSMGTPTRNICIGSNDCEKLNLACSEDSVCKAAVTPGLSAVCVDGQCRYECLNENIEDDCDTSDLLTFGTGGTPIYQPKSTAMYAAACAASEAGCTEYIDPISYPSVSILNNGNLLDVDNDHGGVFNGDGWDAAGSGYTQNVSLDKNTLYTLTSRGLDANIECTKDTLYELNSPNNDLSITPTAMTGIAASNTLLFYYLESGATCIIRIDALDPPQDPKVELKKTIVDYQIQDKVNRSGCNGLVDKSDGCILFNERKFSGSNGANQHSTLTYDADKSENSKSPPACIAPYKECDSNVLLKVLPDRTCNRWLACRSAVQIKDEKGVPENVCYDIGECIELDSKGNCRTFSQPDRIAREYSVGDFGNYANLSGYSKVGIDEETGDIEMKGYYPFSTMSQRGEFVYIPNGNFEFYGENKYPVGWTGVDTSWSSSTNPFSVLNNPVQADAESVTYPMEGRAFLKFAPSSAIIESEVLDVEPNTDYTLSLDINTMNFHPSSKYSYVGSEIYIETFDASDNRVGYNTGPYDIRSCSHSDQPWINSCVLVQPQGKDWEKKVMNFEVGSSTYKIKIKLSGGAWYDTTHCCDIASGDGGCPNYSAGDYNYTPYVQCTQRGNVSNTFVCDSGGGTYTNNVEGDTCSGSVYVDNIQIKPALKVRDNWKIAQECRLYPASESLACSYFEKSGKYQKGWAGYCLEHDRKPGSPDNCVLWWPVDRVKGDGIEEGAGYTDRFPVYYCLEAVAVCEGLTPRFYCSKMVQTVTPIGQNMFWAGRAYPNSGYEVPIAKTGAGKYIEYDSNSGDQESVVLNYNRDYMPFGSIYPGYPDYNPYEWDGRSDAGKQPLYLMRSAGGSTARANTPYYGDTIDCPETLTMDCSSNCFGGVSGGCSQSGVCINCPTGYTMSTTGGGSCGENSGCSGNCGWEGSSNNGNAGWCSIHCEMIVHHYGGIHIAASLDEAKQGVKRLFASTYGYWEWVSGYYKKITSGAHGWGPPEIKCPATGRPEYDPGNITLDYCAIPPIVSNLLISATSTRVVVSNNGYLNLTFNSKVDNQQLPLMMYSVNWGDDEATIISGIEMRDRSNLEEPHSLYHLYDYWDLKKKDTASSTNITCVKGGEILNEPDSGVYNCPTGNNCCMVEPRVRIKDNWGWCNNGITRNDCVNSTYFGHAIIVNQK
jgi:hypothetical protein